MQPLVSIVTPSFNQAQYLETTILSVLRQTYPRIEYIVIDGGSTDGSLELVQKYAERIAYWVGEKDQGQTDAINKGFAQARGDILAWINSDDTYAHPNVVAEAVQFLNKNAEVGMVYADCNFIDEAGKTIGKFAARQTDYAKLRRGYVHIPQQTTFFRASLWREVAPLDPSFYFAMDYDLWTRLARRAPLRYLPDKTWANFRIHATSKTNVNDMRGWREMLRVHYREGGRFFAPIVAKYYLRQLIGPLWKWRIHKPSDS